MWCICAQFSSFVGYFFFHSLPREFMETSDQLQIIWGNLPRLTCTATCVYNTHISVLTIETWTLKFNSLGLSHIRRTTYALHAECTWCVVLHTSSFWYRFSFINFSSLMLVPCLFFCIVIFQSFTRLCLPKTPERLSHNSWNEAYFSSLSSLYRLCVTIFMNEFLRLAWTRTLITEMHVSTYVDLKRTYMIISHAPLLWWGCSFCLSQWNAHNTNKHLPCVSPFNEWRLDTFRCNTIVFDKLTPWRERERVKKKLNENINLFFRRILHTG